MSDADYPYTAQQDSCQYDESKVSVKISNCYQISGDEDALAQKLQQTAPLSIGELCFIIICCNYVCPTVFSSDVINWYNTQEAYGVDLRQNLEV